jgi:hypothetical protein
MKDGAKEDMRRAKAGRGESGQAMVETAIVMPLFVFIILGMFQLSLMHQARYVTKYAAYKAARAGSLHRAKKVAMEDAALAVLLPMAGRPTPDGAVRNTGGADAYTSAWGAAKNNQQYGFPVAEVTVCHPRRSNIAAKDDFDDHLAVSGNNAKDWKPFDRSKLMVQVTFYYRMFIPFANGVLWWITYGKENPELLRVTRLARTKGNTPQQTEHRAGINSKRTVQELAKLADQKVYILPIRASYAVRMHSNVLDNELPTRNECQVPWKKRE